MSNTAKRQAELKIQIGLLFDSFDQTYGYRRIHAELVRGGAQVGPELVRKTDAGAGPYPCQPRPYKTITQRDTDHHAQVPDLVRGEFTAESPGAKLVGDITYIGSPAPRSPRCR
jgi:putative transposase